jgi:purine-nucleoside phosphorylase
MIPAVDPPSYESPSMHASPELELHLAPGWSLHPGFAPELRAAVAAARGAGVRGARVGLVLGSGLGNVVDAMQVMAGIDFADIPGMHASTVQGHAGRLLQTRAGDVDALVLQGRLHAYEGRSLAEVVLPTALLCALGVRVLVLTNAAGGLHPDVRAGDLTVLTDLIDLHLDDPARGVLVYEGDAPIEAALRSARAGRVFDREVAHLLVDTGAAERLSVRTGTYVSLCGPNYETPAEIRQLRSLGADAVGMSTGPEAALARVLGTKVAGVSCITNVAVETGGVEVTHAEVVEVGASRRAELATLLLAALPRLDAHARREAAR